MLLEIRNLIKTYRIGDGGDPVEVLRGVDLRVSAGESVAVTGASGSGKSTILNIVGALDRADSGEVLVEGRDVEKLGEADAAAYRNQTVGFVFQLHNLLPQCTILENVLIPTLAGHVKNTAKIRARAESLIAAVGLEHRVNHRPGQLSGGERQRAAVARALINEPQLLLADEPTGSLDRISSRKLVDLLFELNQTRGVTLVMVTHAPDLAERMGRTVNLLDGKLIEQT